MHLKFLARGTGSAAAAAAYLLAKRDAAGTERAAVEVLRGDPVEVARVADSLTFKYLYTSGVIAWSPEDAPTRAEIERVLDEFEETAWAGLRPRPLQSGRRCGTATITAGCTCTFLAARCDLATGRSLNVASPGVAEDLRPAPRRIQLPAWLEPSRRPGAGAAVPAVAAPGVPGRRDAAGGVGGGAGPSGVDRGAPDGARDRWRVKDRAGVVAALVGLGFDVPRQGRHYVTILRPETGERLRLKGGCTKPTSTGNDSSGKYGTVRDRERADRGDDAKRAADAWRELEEKRLKRAEYHRSRYGGGGRARAGGARDAAGAVEQERGAAAGAVEREAVPESLAGHLRPGAGRRGGCRGWGFGGRAASRA